MLFTGLSAFHFIATNLSTYSTAAWGTAVATHASANTKGSDVEILSDASVTVDCFGIAISLAGPNTAAAIRQFLLDLKIDPAGGTSYITKIANLVFGGGAGVSGGYWYYFPLFIPAGSAIAAAVQGSTGGLTCRVGVHLFGKPTDMKNLKYGSYVETYGAVPASSNGTAITPGNTTKGSYTASLGTTGKDMWWWQGGITINDGTQSDMAYFLDVAAGDATNKKICATDIQVRGHASEYMGKDCFGIMPPYMPVPAGESVYMRSAAAGTPDSSITAVAYALGG